jgi:outer membrane protein OmpA-like peptidoglycan-associated protein
MKTNPILDRVALVGRSLLFVALVGTLGLSAHAQTETATEKKKLDLKEKELELKKKEIDLQKQQLQIDAARKELQMKETEKNVTINLQGDVAFDSGKAALRAEGERSLEKVAVVISQFPESKVLIAGFTDNKGGKDANMRLSEKRAESVKDWLVKHGVKVAAITIKGYGEGSPLAPNQNADGTDNPDGRQQNRRVEITVQK